MVCDRCRTACFRGLVRRLDLEIGFGPASGPWPVWRLAGHSPGTAVFRRFRMSADCGRLPDRLFPWTDPEIGHRNRIRYEGNTGISVCPAVRPAGHHQRTAVFRRFQIGSGGDCLPQLPLSRGPVRRSGLEIGFGPFEGVVIAVVLACLVSRTAGFRRFRIDGDCVCLPDCLFPWIGSRIGHRNRIRAGGNTGISVCPAARPAGHHQRTMIFRLSWFGTVRGYALRRPAEWTGPGIGCGNPTRPPRAGRGRRHAVCVDCRFRCVSLPVSWCSGRRLGPALRYPVSTLRAPCAFKADGMP